MKSLLKRSTVRTRKRNLKASVQRFLPIAEIRQSTVLLKNGGLRAVLQVEALNFNLKSETEQQGIIAGYGAFVNTLSFPVQIVVRSMKTNIDEYLEKLRQTAGKQSNALLKEQTLAHVAFIERILDVADIMQKRFYVVVPLDKGTRKKTLFEQFFDWLHPEDTSAKVSQRNREFAVGLRELSERLDLVQSGLTNIGLHTKRLQTRELLELYYQIFNPKTADREKIPENPDELRTERTTL